MNYYVIVNGAQQGPYQLHQLQSLNITPTTMMWREGLPQWVPASQLPEVSHLFNSAPPQQPQYGQQIYGQQIYGQPGYGRPSGAAHENMMNRAILATVCAFLFSCIGLIFGIIAIVNANKANKAYAVGNDFEGDNANKTAKTMSTIAFILAAVGLVFSDALIGGGIL